MTTCCTWIGDKGLGVPALPEYGISEVSRGNVRKHENPEKGGKGGQTHFFYPLRRRKKRQSSFSSHS